MTWIDTELDAQCRLISFLLLKKIIVGQKKNNLVLKEMNSDLMEPAAPTSETSASAPVDNFLKDISSTISLCELKLFFFLNFIQ